MIKTVLLLEETSEKELFSHDSSDILSQNTFEPLYFIIWGFEKNCSFFRLPPSITIFSIKPPCSTMLLVFFADTGTSSSFRCGLGFLQQNLRYWIYKNSGFNGDTASSQWRSSAFKEGPRTKKTPGNYTVMTEAPTSHMLFSCLDQMGNLVCGLLALSWFLSPCPPHRQTLEFFSCLDTASAVNYSLHIFCFFSSAPAHWQSMES